MYVCEGEGSGGRFVGALRAEVEKMETNIKMMQARPPPLPARCDPRRTKTALLQRRAPA